MAGGVEPGTSSEATVGTEHARAEDVPAQDQPQEIIAHEDEKGGVC